VKAGVWTKAAESSNQGACVEAMPLGGGMVAVRDSKNPDGGKLIFTEKEWSVFVAAVKGGEFDL